jgi:hypothetical protein
MKIRGSLRRWVTLGVVVLGVLGAFVSPVISVFCAAVALNCVLGARENVPFSTYPMFSRPPNHAWALRFEDAQGTLVPVGQIGIHPVIARKRFATEVQQARKRGATDVLEARREAAAVLAEEFEQLRPPNGPWATGAITIAIVEYSLRSGNPVRVQTPLVETPAR